MPLCGDGRVRERLIQACKPSCLGRAGTAGLDSSSAQMQHRSGPPGSGRAVTPPHPSRTPPLHGEALARRHPSSSSCPAAHRAAARVAEQPSTWTATSLLVRPAPAASWAAQHFCIPRTLHKSAGARTATRSRRATAAGAPSGEAAASVEPLLCLLSLRRRGAQLSSPDDGRAPRRNSQGMRRGAAAPAQRHKRRRAPLLSRKRQRTASRTTHLHRNATAPPATTATVARLPGRCGILAAAALVSASVG